MIPKRPEEPSPLGSWLRDDWPARHLDSRRFRDFSPFGSGKRDSLCGKELKEKFAALGNPPEEISNFVPRQGTLTIVSSPPVPSARLQIRSLGESIRPIDREEANSSPSYYGTSPARPTLQHRRRRRRKPYFTIPSGIYRFVLARLFAPTICSIFVYHECGKSCLVID